MTTENMTALQVQNNNQLSVLGAFANNEQFQMVMQAADMLSKSNMIPTTYQGNPGSCFIALNTALRLKIDPLMVMQNLYVVQGRPSWSGQFAIAMVNACGKFSSTWFEYKNGDDYKEGVRMCAKLSSETVVCGTWITPEMVQKEKWGMKWQSMPEQMYQYRAAAFFARTNCPEALFGMSVEGEVEDIHDPKNSGGNMNYGDDKKEDELEVKSLASKLVKLMKKDQITDEQIKQALRVDLSLELTPHQMRKTIENWDKMVAWVVKRTATDESEPPAQEGELL